MELEPIAIVGMACRFPGAPSLEALWDLLSRGGDAIVEVPPDRYDVEKYYDPRPAIPGKMMGRYGGFLDHVDTFDAGFFGISPREASRIDPQHRLLMEVSWEAMEDAGIVPSTMSEEEKLDLACYMGIITGDYWDQQFHHLENLDVYGTAGSARSGAAGRLSFSMDLKGTSFAIDAACSSSLVAVDQAIHTLRGGIYTTALAGGVNVILNPDHNIGFSQGKMMAADGHSKAFDAAADGYVRSEGAGVVVLKLLSRAQADGDRIYAVIRGSAANNDGHGETFMAPSTQGQQLGLRKACRNAGVDPHSISYVEAHGPGTKAGDPVEITTLGEILGKGRPADHPLYVGSIKTNIGHLEGGSGVAGLIKATLTLVHRQIPANLHFHEPSPAIPWDEYPMIKIPTELMEWPERSEPRRAVVCSYGIAGTNTYVVLEEAPLQEPATPSDDQQQSSYLLPISARSSDALTAQAERYADYLDLPENAGKAIHDISYTASVRRAHHDHRLAAVVSSKEEARDLLRAFRDHKADPRLVSGRKVERKQQKIAWIFPGQGSQWLHMGRDLFVQEPAFRATIEACDRVMSQYVNWSLLELLQENEDPARLDEINIIQPMLFAMEVALAELWRSWGIEPDAVVGHSMGETAAAYIAGALSLEDAAWVICSRSELALRQKGKGLMASVELSMEQARDLLREQHVEDLVSVAVSNSPSSTVLSGDSDALQNILAVLENRGVFARLVRVDFASHSPQMDPLRDDLLDLMQRVQPHASTVPMFSTVRGAFVQGDELNARYWVDNLREPVLFLNATQELLEQGYTIFMEMSPHPILVGAIRQTIEFSDKDALALASLRRGEGRGALLTTLGTLYTQGYDIDWPRFYPHGGRHESLPTYAWQRQRHWNDRLGRQARGGGNSSGGHPILNTSVPLAHQDQSYLWTTEIDAELFPYLSEHRVHEMPVLPGAAYIELALAAATEIFGLGQFRIEDIQLKKVLFFPPDVNKTLQVVMTPDAEHAGKWTLQFYSQTKQEKTWTQHAQATVQQLEEPQGVEEVAHLLPEQFPDVWSPALEPAAFYEGIRARGIQHGPLFQGVTQLWQRPQEILVQITPPEEVASDAGYQVHPALMDAILQATIPFLPEDNPDETYVPVAVKRVKYHQPSKERVGKLWSHAVMKPQTTSGTIDSDITILDEDGQILLEILGFRLQSLDGDTQGLMRQRLKQLVYGIEWEQVERGQQLQQRQPRLLLLRDASGAGQLVARYLRARGAECIEVTPGETYRRVGTQEYQLNPAEPAAFQQLFSEQIGNIDGVVYLWDLQTEVTRETLDMNHDLNCIGLLHTLQALAREKKETAPRLFIVTNGVHPIEEGDETIALPQAALWGMGRVIVYEHQDLQSTLIDINALPSEEDLDALCAEIVSGDEADEVALRGERRYVARLQHHSWSDEQETSAPLFYPDGTYLITGGLGGVGLRVAQWMIEQGARYLVLLGRRGPDKETQETLQKMRASGAVVNLLRVDVSQEEELSLALNQVRRTMPPLRGVFHSAVVLNDSILVQLEREGFLAVMPPKVAGAWNLHKLTQYDPLDYFVLFSSAASLIGSPGQGNYAAANAFIDALAHHRRSRGLPAMSINWGRWGEVGQAMKGDRGERLSNRGFASMKPVEGLAVLAELLRQSLVRQNPSQIGVMSFQFARWSQFYPKLAKSSLFAHFLPETTSSQAAEVRLSPEAFVGMESAERQATLMQYLSSQVARVLGHTSATFDEDQALNRLGIDSLMSVELKNRIGTDLGVTIPVALLLQGVTLGELATQILAQLELDPLHS